MFSYKSGSCCVFADDKSLIIENEFTKRAYVLENGMLKTGYVIDKASGYVFGNSDLNEGTFDGEVSVSFDDRGFRAEKHLLISVFCKDDYGRRTEHRIRLFDKSPFIFMDRTVYGMPSAYFEAKEHDISGVENAFAYEEARKGAFDDVVDMITMPKAHIKAKSVRFFDKTDRYDTLVKEDTQLLYSRQNYECEGNILILSDTIRGISLMAVKNAPTHTSSVGHSGTDFNISKGHVSIVGTGFDGSMQDKSDLYGSIVGIGKTEDIKLLFKRHAMLLSKGERSGHTFIMSNTWGDRNRDASLCEEFMLKEIETAHRIGVDIVQIDDGWQKGVSANSVKGGGTWSGYYDADKDFWKVNPERFPNGLKPLIKRAKEYAIEIGLWFAPDSSNDFANHAKDAESILDLYREYGIRYFKLDSVNFFTKLGESNFISLMNEVQEKSNNDIVFNLDVTAQNRLGYIYEADHGTLFVENRYSDWGNYYPHNTLKNLWSLSKYIPSRRLLFEVLNNKRNPDKYENDPLAPKNYRIDYEFASVMLSNPLIWMEMSRLEECDIKALEAISKVYGEHRSTLWNADITPIGDSPDGTSFTGFEAVCPDGSVYLLLFREKSAEKEYEYCLSRNILNMRSKILAQSDENSCLELTNRGARFICQTDFSYLFAKLF